MVIVALIMAACGDNTDGDAPTVDVVAEGLLNPIGLAALPDGGILIAEEGTGDDDTSAGVSLLVGGSVRRVVSGLPSGRDSGDLTGAPLVGVSPDGATAYVAHFNAGSLLTFPAPSAKAAATAAPLGPNDLVPAMEPLNRVALLNPFDIAFSPDGVPVVTDASGNGVATQNPDGTTVFIHRFDTLPAPGNESLRVDAVPTGIAAVGDEYYVTLTGGCPYPSKVGRLVAIDGARNQRVVVGELDMPIDVAVDGDGTVWVLEFARFDPDASCFTGEGYLPGTGRLSRLDGDRLETVLDGLDFPGAVLPTPDGSLYVTEVFAGRVLRVAFDEPAAASQTVEAEDWALVDVAQETGLDFRHGAFRFGLSMDPVAAMGAGLCWLDYDRDGWLDLYLVNSHSLDEADAWRADGGLPSNTLFRNDEGSFENVSAQSGADLAIRGNGCTAADFDGDGWTDIYVTADGANALLHNNGDATFTDIAADLGVLAPEWSTAAPAADLNGDGRLDLFVGTYIDLERKVENPVGAFPQDYLGVADHLFLSRSDGTYEDVAAATGLDREDRALGAIFSDLDGDGDLDLYIANDGQPNRLYERAAGPEVRFEDVTRSAGVGDPGSGMGVAGGDYDGDGALDLFVTNWQRELHALYRNENSLEFLNTTQRIGLAGLGNNSTGWGTAWADVDNDGDLDLLTVNGMVPITDLDADRQQVRVFGNLTSEGTPGQFRDWTQQLGLATTPLLARGSAVADYDNDGDLDLAVATIGGPPALFRNDGPPGNSIQVVLDPFSPGSVVTVELDDGTVLITEARAGGSYLASEDPRLHFGLGDRTTIRRVTATWPTGETEVINDVDAGTTLRVTRG